MTEWNFNREEVKKLNQSNNNSAVKEACSFSCTLFPLKGLSLSRIDVLWLMGGDVQPKLSLNPLLKAESCNQILAASLQHYSMFH